MVNHPPISRYCAILQVDTSSFRPSSSSVKRALGSQREAMVGKAHQVLDYAALEVPLPLFGLGHDWACTFRGAPLPF
jgi:hypothetical protein